MQGTLSEIDIRSIFQLIALGQRTGELFVEAYPSSDSAAQNSASLVNYEDNILCWFVFFVNGQIIYATSPDSRRLTRLKDYLHPYQLPPIPSSLGNEEMATKSDPEYAYLWLLLEKQLISPQLARHIVKNMVQETLFDLLSLHQGAFIFETGAALAPQLTRLAVSPLIPKIIKQVQQWKQFYPHIQWPQQYFQISHAQALEVTLPDKAYQNLVHWAEQKTSLRQLSRYLNRDLPTLAKGIYPYVERGWLHLVNPSQSVETAEINQNQDQSPIKRPKIACIDDDITISKTIEGILTEHNYPVTVFNDPLAALTQLFYLKPDIILCDITMPYLDGYELCAMIRHSHAFRQTPLIMLTGKDAFLDRVRARMVGATDYLTKPFGENELLLLLERYLPSLSYHPLRSL